VKVLNETDVECKVIKGGLLKKRGINLPETKLDVPALADEDIEALTEILTKDKGNQNYKYLISTKKNFIPLILKFIY
jgi:pyruvate kinase